MVTDKVEGEKAKRKFGADGKHILCRRSGKRYENPSYSVRDGIIILSRKLFTTQKDPSDDS
jgi:hypothetical protein